MKNEDYVTKFLELLSYVPYLVKDEKAKFQIFFNGLPLSFRDWIEYDEPQSLEDVIGKLTHYYEQSKHKNEYQQGWKGKDKGKGKWKLKRTKPHNPKEKENVAPYKKFNVARQVHGSQQQNIGDGIGQLECCTCGKEHLKRDCLQNQGVRPHIYSAQEAQKVGDIGQSIPWIYAALDNKQAEHQATVIEMDSKLCDQVVSILIYPRSNYSYVIPNLVDKCGLNK